MSSVNLENLTAEFPSHKVAIEKLVLSLEKLADEITRPKFYSYDRIATLSGIQSNYELVLLLHRLVENGLLEQFIRVENNHAGIGDFPTIDDVPEEIHDERQDITVIVTPDKLRLFYKLNPRALHAG